MEGLSGFIKNKFTFNLKYTGKTSIFHSWLKNLGPKKRDSDDDVSSDDDNNGDIEEVPGHRVTLRSLPSNFDDDKSDNEKSDKDESDKSDDQGTSYGVLSLA